MRFPNVEFGPTKFAVGSFNELVYRISCFRGLSHGDCGGDGDAVVGLLKVSSQTSR